MAVDSPSKHAFSEASGFDACPFLPVFGAPAVMFARGSGTELWDTAGKRYLDFLCGLAVTSLGHAHPAVADALADQSRTLLGEPSPRDRVFCHFPHGTPNQAQSIPGMLPGTYVRKGDWKLLRFYADNEDGSDRFELYNLKDDVGETKNLAATQPAMLALMRARLAAVSARDRDAVANRLKGLGAKITEREAKSVLACYGLPVTQEALAATADEAVAHAAKIGGKVVLKIDSPDIAHKTEAGGVKLGVEGRAAIGEAFDAIMKSAKAYAPAAKLNGVLVQEMAKPGVELMLGVIRDPVFGPVVAVGLGGIFVEVLKDISYRAAPVTPVQAREMLDELRGKKLLEGVRGMPARDRDAVVDAIVRLSWFAADFRDEVAELDINPVMVYEQGAGLRVLDALIVRPS